MEDIKIRLKKIEVKHYDRVGSSMDEEAEDIGEDIKRIAHGKY